MKRSTYAIMLATIGAMLGVAAPSKAPSRVVIVAQAPSSVPSSPAPSADKSRPDDPGFYAGEAGLSPSERAGREIWYKATAGNARFHTYVFPATRQRADRLVPRAAMRSERDDRFAAWGIINDPGCCVPGSEGCPAKSLERNLRLRLVPGRRGAADVRRQRPAIATRPATSRMRRSTPRTRTPRRRTSGSRRATSRSALPPARSAIASSRTRASTRRAGSSSTAAWRAGRATADDCRKSEVERRSTQPPRRRLDRAAVPDRNQRAARATSRSTR